MYNIIYMKFIKKLILENFEGWVKGNINFTNGFNVIIGDSDSGKSSLFRAIESIFTGKVAQENINKNAKSLKVELKFSDDSIFIREYGKKGNKISFNDITFERIGREVPSEYFDKLGKSFIYLNDKNKVDLCLYSQFDPHFFINFSDYDKSKLIGNICGIGSIDKLLDLINKDIRDNNSKVKFLDEQIKEKEPKVDILQKKYNEEKEHYNKLEEKYNNIEKDYKMLEIFYNSYNNILELQQEESKIKNKLNNNKKIISSFNIDLISQLESLNEILQKYISIITNIENIQCKINKNKLFLDFKIEDNELKTINNISNELNKLNFKIDNLEKLKKENLYNLSKLEEEQKNIMKNFKQCPLCGSKIHG